MCSGRFSMSGFGAIIVTFNPNINILKDNISSVINQVDTIVVLDNGSSNVKNIELLVKDINDDKIMLIQLHENLGIAKAQNIGMKIIEEQKLDWSFILDQDSVLPTDAICLYTGTKEFLAKDTAILSARHVDDKWNEAQRKSYFGELDMKVIPVKLVIASGNLVRVSAWRDVGGFDDDLFIDQVDFDFDAKLLLKDYKVYQVDAVVMKHQIGKTIQRPVLSKLLLYKSTTLFIDHSPFREYYIAKNSIIFAKRYPELRIKGNLQILKIILDTRKILGYEKPRWSKIFKSIKGIVAGLMYNPKKDIKFQLFLNGTSEKN